MGGAPADDVAHDAPPTTSDRGSERWLTDTPVSVVAVLAIVVIGAIRLIATLHRPFTSGGDVAFIELSVREALRWRVALGPYSRFGWHHLGPALFYLYAPIYALSGDSSRALFVDSWLLNGGCAVGAVLLVRRASGEPAARLAAAAFCLYVGATTFGSMINPWNPSLLAMPMVLMLIAA